MPRPQPKQKQQRHKKILTKRENTSAHTKGGEELKQKKMPERLCLGCNVSKDKRELIRVVKTKTGEIFLDKTGKANGRGAYICNDAACLEKAIKTKRISRSLAVEIPAEVYDALRQAIQNDEQ